MNQVLAFKRKHLNGHNRWCFLGHIVSPLPPYPAHLYQVRSCKGAALSDPLTSAWSCDSLWPMKCEWEKAVALGVIARFGIALFPAPQGCQLPGHKLCSQHTSWNADHMEQSRAASRGKSMNVGNMPWREARSWGHLLSPHN